MASVKLTNTVDGDRVLPGVDTFVPVVIPAHRSVEVDSDHWGKVKGRPVVKAWLDAGEIKTGESAAKAEAKSDEKPASGSRQ